MARTERSADATLALLSALEASPGDFDFYQALRLIERCFPDRPRLGESKRPADDPVRLGQHAHLGFATSTIARLERGEGGVPRIEVAFFGLFGPNGPMPLHITEYVHDRQRNSGDDTWARFADMFHHRMLSLFYRAWANAQPAVGYDRVGRDRFAIYVGSLAGYGTPRLLHGDSMPANARCHYSGWFNTGTRSAEGLQAIVGDYLRLPVAVEEFVGHWLDLPSDSRLRLGESPATGSLGTTATLGARVWDCQFKFRLVIGPVRLVNYRRLLPGTETLKRLSDIVRNYAGDEFDWEANLLLEAGDVPEATLGDDQQLGWTTWLGTRHDRTPAGDLFLDPRVRT
jgi:type VI secretion system protein ImpH